MCNVYFLAIDWLKGADILSLNGANIKGLPRIYI